MQKEEESAHYSCPICRKGHPQFSPSCVILIMTCGHEFCFTCAISYFKNHHKACCPVCKQSCLFTKEEIDCLCTVVDLTADDEEEEKSKLMKL